MKTASAVSSENASGIFMRRACCEMYHYCFQKGGICPPGHICVSFLHPTADRPSAVRMNRRGDPWAPSCILPTRVPVRVVRELISRITMRVSSFLRKRVRGRRPNPTLRTPAGTVQSPGFHGLIDSENSSPPRNKGAEGYRPGSGGALHGTGDSVFRGSPARAAKALSRPGTMCHSL